MPSTDKDHKTLELADAIKRPIVIVLLFTMLALVAVSTVQLLLAVGYEIWNAFSEFEPTTLLEAHFLPLLDLFGLFLSVFIAVELVESVEVYLKGEGFHVEAVIGVALIAVARKVILLDYKAYDPLTIIGIGIVIISLATGYFLMRRSEAPRKPEME